MGVAHSLFEGMHYFAKNNKSVGHRLIEGVVYLGRVF